jgi:hypothetical protein
MIKKITLLVLLVASMLNVSSQSLENEMRLSPTLNSPSHLTKAEVIVKNKNANTKLYKGTTGEGWYRYLNAYSTATGNITYYSGQPIWKDSLPVVLYDGVPNNINLHAVGQMFDPKSDLFAEPEAPALSRFNRYTVDSLIFFYKYQNFNPGSVDTLLVQFYNADKISRLFYRANGLVVGYSDNPTYDKANKIGVSTSSMKILLTEADNTDSFFRTTFASFGDFQQLALPAAINVPENRTFGYTVTYLPGVSANMGDTIIYSGTPTSQYPKKKLNTFQPRLFQENDNLGDTSYNYALVSFSSTRYSTRTTEWFGGSPGINGSKKLSTDAMFKVRYYNLSAKDINSQGYGLGNVYPNPVKAGSDINIEFALGRGENVNIDLFNVLGSKLANISHDKFKAGDNSVTFNTGDLAPGVYVYTLTAGPFKSSKKFTVTN